MKFLKSSLSIISIIMFSATIIVGASAANFTYDKTYDSKTLLENDPISSFYIMPYGNMIKENNKNLNLHANEYNDLIGKINNKNLVVKEVKKTRGKLKPGDMVQVKNSTNPFLLYLGKDKNGYIHLENSYNKFIYTKKIFDTIYTGKIIEITENTPNISSVEAKTVEKSANTIISISGQSNEYNWKNAYQDPRIIELTEKVTEGKETSWDKCEAIFYYVQTNYKWHDHDNTLCSLNDVLNNKTGNCCELSRLEVAMVKSLDMDVETRYKHANVYYYRSNAIHGHIYAQFMPDDNWVDADSSTDGIIFGQECQIYKEICSIGYYDELAF
ncbi:MAG: transglutaminase-like domain-containing protein [Methanobacterium sp.]|nr:transglutaminase-like domain-containing protein [Methanobacterium sp.]